MRFDSVTADGPLQQHKDRQEDNMSSGSKTYVHDFDEKNGMADEVDPRVVSIEMLAYGITITAFDEDAFIGIKYLSYEQLWREAVI